ncbi:MAG: 50S ribosomal protein L6 [Candidatus Wildermuthbacteria bacterium RIFCSPLOWO2_12_FULL_40_9]|uniref:Large ribosomal subunit protein uL6 n=2 Tax=Candidatus Wildermuthiibacteriota TaxID=1817923 RepID=A0A1G2RBE6_9BACT|nr:MAG: 50S ribosomal protein L6 [Candidatus Wildermuthbacteria bacterium RIFCSPHIGHO2_12_FULL_40_12]OHA76454.1 MAG: 50S ribosomal protein L6 [Candidatus Wildermuthbacteria bacterium RIFCSPLOWO2_12_FULL_40_9]
MSRIGKKSITILEGVDVQLAGQRVTVRGPKGELQMEIRPEIKMIIADGKILLSPQIEAKETKALWGLTRALISNMVIGVTAGYEKKLSIEGIGFRALLEGDKLVLYVGLSHSVPFEAPMGIKFTVEKNIITVSGINKNLVTQTAANIRKISKPEPYKGKGIRYLGEIVRRKTGKKAVATK